MKKHPQLYCIKQAAKLATKLPDHMTSILIFDLWAAVSPKSAVTCFDRLREAAADHQNEQYEMYACW